VGFSPDVMLQTGQKMPFERALESKLAASVKQATKASMLTMGAEFFNDMHAQTASVMGDQAACGVPGSASDKRRGGCVIPVNGPTVDLACCTSCCQGLMGECGPCDGLLPEVPHTAKQLGAPMAPSTSMPESVDCGTPGGPSDIRRAGCVIPVDGPTVDLTCCTSCCQGLMGECGDCSGLGTSVPHTVVD